MSNEITWEEFGNKKLSELNEEEREFALMLLDERLEELNAQLEHYQALQKIEEKRLRAKGIRYICRRRKYPCANLRHHAHEERSDTKEV